MKAFHPAVSRQSLTVSRYTLADGLSSDSVYRWTSRKTTKEICKKETRNDWVGPLIAKFICTWIKWITMKAKNCVRLIYQGKVQVHIDRNMYYVQFTWRSRGDLYRKRSSLCCRLRNWSLNREIMNQESEQLTKKESWSELRSLVESKLWISEKMVNK